jgi:hypothetical protein
LLSVGGEWTELGISLFKSQLQSLDIPWEGLYSIDTIHTGHIRS